MAGTLLGSWWQNSRWLHVIARGVKSNVADFAANGEWFSRLFCNAFWNPNTATGFRPWLATAFNNKSGINPAVNGYKLGDCTREPVYNLMKILDVIDTSRTIHSL